VTIQGCRTSRRCAKIFNTISENSVVVDMIIQNIGEGADGHVLYGAQDRCKKINEVMRKVVAEIGAKNVNIKEDVSKISIVGVGIAFPFGRCGKDVLRHAKEGSTS